MAAWAGSRRNQGSAAVDNPNRQPGREALPQTSARFIRLFAWYAPRFVRKDFNAVRVLGEVPDAADPRAWLVYLNHPSWWDPMALAVLVGRHYRGRTGYGPIDAQGLEKYRFLEKLGFFGIDPESSVGAKRFLQLGRAVLGTPGQTLWVTAQGGFTDPRERPVRLRPGVAHLARRAKGAVAYPLALEYPFWEEKQPEMLLCFGEPVVLGAAAGRALGGAAQWNVRLERGLEAAMDRLAAASAARDAAAFTTLLDGRRGVNPVYDLWRRGRAALWGERFDPGHGEALR